MGTLAIGKKQRRRAPASVPAPVPPATSALLREDETTAPVGEATTYVSFGAFSFLGLWSFTVERRASSGAPESGEQAN